ncbi:chlorohydrolase [Deltaproteobacteria bacterium]|nr:chlorohydrolase [Deltaproteobacteria bacterium]
MLYLRNARYLDSVTFAFFEGNIAVEEGKNGDIRLDVVIPPLPERNVGDREFDCKGQLVMRALSCGHHHIYSILSRGMPPLPRTPQNFNEMLELVWWRLDKCLDNDMTYASALAAGLFMAKNGVVFCIDHHASPLAADGSLSAISKAFEQIGIGHLLCHETSDRDGIDIAMKSLAEHERFFAAGGKGHVGLHASFTVSDDTLKAAVALAQQYDTGIHIHVAEARSDQKHCLATYGKTVVQRMKDAGVLDMPKTILGHCVHVSEEDKAILAASPVWIAQNVESNMNNNVGLGDYSFSKNVMFGTDGMHSDMIRSAQAAYFTGVMTEGQTLDGAYKRLRNAHRHTALHGPVGDGANNLIIFNYDSPTPLIPDLSHGNVLGHFFYGLSAKNVSTVVSRGKIIVENCRLVSGDEEEILAAACEQGKRLWEKLR